MKKQKLVGCLTATMKEMGLSKTAASRILHVNPSTFCRYINSPEDAKFGTLSKWLDELQELSKQINHIANDHSQRDAELKMLGLGDK